MVFNDNIVILVVFVNNDVGWYLMMLLLIGGFKILWCVVLVCVLDGYLIIVVIDLVDVWSIVWLLVLL